MLDEDDDRLLPSNSLEATSLIVTPDKRNSVMTTTATTKNLGSNSFGFTSPSTTEETCNICKRLLYAFEEILRCRVCYGKYHWRCVKPQRVSRYGQNHDYICVNCNDSTAINSSHRLSNGNNITEPFDANEISRTNSTESNPENNIRHYEDQQQSQSQKTRKITELDDYLPSQTNEEDEDEDEEEYHHENSQSNDDNRRIQQQQQQNGIDSDDEDDTSAMFQANYQYTPLKEYAAMKNIRTTNDNNINKHPNPPTDNFDRQSTSRYGGGLQYTNHGYDPTVTRLVEAPSISSTNLTSPTADNIPTNNRQTHFISTTNLNISEKPSHRQQPPPPPPNSIVHSTSYSPSIRQNDVPIFRAVSQEQTDRHLSVENDSDKITVTKSSQQQQQPKKVDENQIVEKKLANLVQQLGKQLENDAQKLNDKLEIRLKDLENMIHQQTYVIRRQDEVIERLKSQIQHIETERDHFRHRLSVHEQNETKKPITTKEPEKSPKRDSIYEQPNNQSDIKHSNTPTDNNKPSIKKAPAPRVDTQRSIVNDGHESTITKFVKTVPTSRTRLESDSSSDSYSSVTGKVISPPPVVETPAASTRLDTIIRQSSTKDAVNPSPSNYSLAQVRHQDRPQTFERVSIEQKIVTSIHHDDSDDENDKDDLNNNNNNNTPKQARSISSSSSGSSPTLPTQPVKVNGTTTASRNPNRYPSFESLQHTYQNEQNPKLSTKTTSLQFGIKPVRDDEPGSIYMTPPESNRPAIQLNSTVKGWLRKQNRESFLKRIERYFCVLRSNALLMYRHDIDQTPYKAINLKGAKVLYYDDTKYGPSLELTWSNQTNDPKHYHLYAPNPQEADQWLMGIKTAILNLENKTNWLQYRMNK